MFFVESRRNEESLYRKS